MGAWMDVDANDKAARAREEGRDGVLSGPSRVRLRAVIRVVRPRRTLPRPALSRSPDSAVCCPRGLLYLHAAEGATNHARAFLSPSRPKTSSPVSTRRFRVSSLGRTTTAEFSACRRRISEFYPGRDHASLLFIVWSSPALAFSRLKLDKAKGSFVAAYNEKEDFPYQVRGSLSLLGGSGF